jgi:hypothetical protein
MYNVRQVKDEFLQKFPNFGKQGPVMFWGKLSQLGHEKRTQSAGDVDATAFLSETEYKQLKEECNACI